MNSELLQTLEKEEKVRQKKLSESYNDKEKDFSWVLFFAGDEFNQELVESQELKQKLNLIDFSEVKEEGKWIETTLKDFLKKAENKQLIDGNKCPIVWFKNIEKIKSGSSLEKALIPVFDPHQNTKLFSEEIDLSNYILLATTSTHDISRLSAPLASRLDCINVETAKPKRFFLDEYFGWVLAGSVFLIVILLIWLFWPNKSKMVEK